MPHTTFKDAVIDQIHDSMPADADKRTSKITRDPAIIEPKQDERNSFEPSPPTAADSIELTVRAENVLKELSMDLQCGIPSQGKWRPPDILLEQLTYEHLVAARNCGPQTIAEITRWAQTRGKEIRRSFHSGKSLSLMWADIVARFSTGELTTTEIAAALDRSTRRRNTKIPVDIQKLLLKMIAPSRR